MAPILEGLNPESYDRAYSDGELLRRIRPLFTARRWVVVLIAVMVLGTAAAGVTLPLVLSMVVDTADSVGESVVPLVLAAVLSGVAAWLFTFVQARAVGRLVGDVVLQMRDRAFRAVLRQDQAFFDTHTTGSIASRVTSDTQAFATLLTLTLNVVGQILMVGIMLLALFVVNSGLAVVTGLVAVVIVRVSLLFRRVSRRASQQQQRSLAEIHSYVQETLRGIAVARNFRREKSTYDGLVEVNRRWFRATLRMNRLFSGIFPLLLTLTGLGTVAVAWLGGRNAAAGGLSAGEWALFFEALTMFWFPLTAIASYWSQFQQGLAAAERIFALVDRTPGVVQKAELPVPELHGRIEFQGVTFGYGDGDPVLKECDLVIRPGETVALVGHTGAGKSSIVRLIGRAYEFQAGRILVDGRDLRELDLAQYRAHLGVVAQTPYLFSGTVGENIGHGREGAGPAEIEAAARAVAGGDWVDLLPEGLGTPTTEGGRNLSTGQRQLIALSRVVLQDPAVFVLDEATASVDPLTEALVQEGLDTLSAGRTTIVVAHRLPTVRKADRIVVLDHGVVVEQGDHDTLLKRGGAYAELYDAYFRHQQPDFDPAATDPSGDAGRREVLDAAAG
ncbi:ABC transporter ATP-binding protein [Streptomyces collinus]|uniref:ABC transporter ATP-binding protein n=1 Tax=Streptomyces collinus TaxID=42684 RepID=UPI00367ECDBD